MTLAANDTSAALSPFSMVTQPLLVSVPRSFVPDNLRMTFASSVMVVLPSGVSPSPPSSFDWTVTLPISTTAGLFSSEPDAEISTLSTLVISSDPPNTVVSFSIYNVSRRNRATSSMDPCARNLYSSFVFISTCGMESSFSTPSSNFFTTFTTSTNVAPLPGLGVTWKVLAFVKMIVVSAWKSCFSCSSSSPVR